MGESQRPNGNKASPLGPGASRLHETAAVPLHAFPHKVQYNDAAVLEQHGGKRLSWKLSNWAAYVEIAGYLAASTFR